MPGAGGGGSNHTPLTSVGECPPPPYPSMESTPAVPSRDPDADRETWISTRTWDSAQTPTNPAAEDPRMVDRLDPQAGGHPEDRREEDHLVDA